MYNTCEEYYESTGIGQVVNVRFTSSFSTVLWDPPATAGVLSGLSYIVIVMNNNTGQVIVNATTTNTNYTLPVLKSCQYYTANVTVFYKTHFGDSIITGQRVPESEYKCIGIMHGIMYDYCVYYFRVLQTTTSVRDKDSQT